MRGRKLTSLGAAVWIACTAGARAADPPKKTPFVINESVEIPGMILEPGRYVLRLVEPGSERNVLQVFEVVQLWTGDEGRLLSTLLTMPNYDRPTTDKTVFTFYERGAKTKALRLWFPPGRNCGQEFVYPKAQAVELAKAVGRGVLSMPPELPGDIGMLNAGAQRGAAPARAPMPAPASQPFIPKPAPVTPVAKQQPAQKPTPPPPPSPSPSAAVRAVNEAPGSAASSAIQSRSRAIDRLAPQAPASLPKTDGYLPLAAALGIAGIILGILLRLLALRLEQR